jgi:putative thioredoxin
MTYEVKNFEEDVIQRSYQIPVLVDFWAEWCGPCRVLSPVLEQLAQQNDKRWALAKVNTEEFSDLTAQYGIQGIPNVKLFFEGTVLTDFVGALPEHVIVQWLKNNVPSKHKTKIELAKTLLGEQRTVNAENVLAMIFTEEPDNQEVKSLLAKGMPVHRS